MSYEVRQWIIGIWTVVGALWFLTGLRLKPSVRVQNTGSRTGQLLLLAISAALLFSTVPQFEWLEAIVFPPTATTAIVGVGLTVVGALFAIVARLYLGSNWSARPTVRDDHEVICRGPYAIVRHPIYTGMLVAAVGTAVAFGEVRHVAALPLLLLGFWLKLRSEERLLAESMGEQYVRYRRAVTSAIIPFVL